MQRDRDPYSRTIHTKPLCMLSGVPLLSIPSEVYRVLKHDPVAGRQWSASASASTNRRTFHMEAAGTDISAEILTGSAAR